MDAPLVIFSECSNTQNWLHLELRLTLFKINNGNTSRKISVSLWEIVIIWKWNYAKPARVKVKLKLSYEVFTRTHKYITRIKFDLFSQRERKLSYFLTRSTMFNEQDFANLFTRSWRFKFHLQEEFWRSTDISCMRNLSHLIAFAFHFQVFYI